MQVLLDPNSIEDYRMFLKIKRLPRCKITGRMAEFPDEYAHLIGLSSNDQQAETTYKPIKKLFDYQRDIAALALRKKKFAVFADCGLGKTLMFLEWVRYVKTVLPKDKRILIISPLMVIKQTMDVCRQWYGSKLHLNKISARELPAWLAGIVTERVGITNYDALTDDLQTGQLGAMVLDESSMLKSHYGKWGTTCIRLGRGLEWKIALTGTPAPNDRIEYANHAVFLDAFPTVNSFLARYFVNKGQTQERWVLRPHALTAFYRDLSHWCIFLTNPATYGWKDNCDTIPPIHIHIHDVDLTADQREAVYQLTGKLFMDEVGGITKRSALSRIGKGDHNGQKIDTHKFDFIRSLVESWPKESTLVWCRYNSEQEMVANIFPDCANLSGDTPQEKREELIDDFKAARRRVMVSKAKILGFGLDLQIATRQIFSCLQDSYEEFYQCVKRSNRIGSKFPLNVHVPVSEIERPMVENVLRKASRVQADTEEQERFFKANRIEGVKA